MSISQLCSPLHTGCRQPSTFVLGLQPSTHLLSPAQTFVPGLQPGSIAFLVAKVSSFPCGRPDQQAVPAPADLSHITWNLSGRASAAWRSLSDACCGNTAVTSTANICALDCKVLTD